MEIMYTASATSIGGREGHVKSSDGIIDMELVHPVGMGGKGGAANPELLFAAGYSACFNGALHLVARTNRVRIGEPAVTAEVSIGKDPAGGFKIAVVMSVVMSGLPQAQADELVKEAHAVCPYSKATRGNVEVTLKAIVK